MPAPCHPTYIQYVCTKLLLLQSYPSTRIQRSFVCMVLCLLPRARTCTLHRSLVEVMLNLSKDLTSQFLNAKCFNNHAVVFASSFLSRIHGAHLFLHRRDDLGSLRLKVQVHEQRILPNHYYDQFTDFMVNAVQEPRLAVSSLCSQPDSMALFQSIPSTNCFVDYT